MVSVVIPVYRKEKYISKTIQSVLKSTYKNFELIIVNDGSDDNTEEIVLEWGKLDPRIKYIYQENAGVCAARNNGINQARGLYILPLDADDLIGNKYLEKAVNAFEQNPSLTLVYSKAAKFFDDSFFVIPWFLGRYSFGKILGMNLIQPAAFFKKTDFLKTNGYDLKMIFGVEDWDFWIELLTKANKNVKQLDYFGYYYRANADNSRHSAFNSNKENIINTYDYIYQKHRETYQKYYDNLPFDEISQLNYYKFKVDRLEYIISFINPKNALKMLMDLILIQRKK